MRYIFQQSGIWDGCRQSPDPKMPVAVIKMRKADGAKALRKLPPAELGRVWLLLRMEA